MMTFMTWRIRPAQPDDLGFLEDMLYEAATWRGSDARPERVLRDQHISRYLAGWGRPGDTALIATDDQGRLAGAAWFRFFSADDAGYGFLDETTPELSIAVVPQSRGRGAGTFLMSALIATARERGIGALSLSVETDNRARRLYERLGFRPVRIDEGAMTMRLDL